jgi:hypothetical protein
MPTNTRTISSRREFSASAGIAAAALLGRRYLFADEDGIVQMTHKEAAVGNVTVQPLRRNISVLINPGGNVAVLTGADGKLLIDAFRSHRR